MAEETILAPVIWLIGNGNLRIAMQRPNHPERKASKTVLNNFSISHFQLDSFPVIYQIAYRAIRIASHRKRFVFKSKRTQESNYPFVARQFTINGNSMIRGFKANEKPLERLCKWVMIAVNAYQVDWTMQFSIKCYLKIHPFALYRFRAWAGWFVYFVYEQ